MKKKIVIGFMSVLVVVGLIAGCGSSGDKASSYDMTEVWKNQPLQRVERHSLLQQTAS